MRHPSMSHMYLNLFKRFLTYVRNDKKWILPLRFTQGQDDELRLLSFRTNEMRRNPSELEQIQRDLSYALEMTQAGSFATLRMTEQNDDCHSRPQSGIQSGSRIKCGMTTRQATGNLTLKEIKTNHFLKNPGD